jgi:hypothetical protein
VEVPPRIQLARPPEPQERDSAAVEETELDEERVPAIKPTPWGLFRRLPKEDESPAKEEPPAAACVDTASDDELNDMMQFRGGFLQSIDFLINHPRDLSRLFSREETLRPLIRFLFITTLVASAIYGAVMGATNFLQGSSMEVWGKIAMLFVTAFKVPLLFLLTLGIVLPPIYVSNAFVGARLTFRQVFALLLASLAITATLLASMGTVAFFFALTSGSYHFIKLLHVSIFVYAGLGGLYFLVIYIQKVESASTARTTPVNMLVVWLVLFAFVGTQLAWWLRPFVGSPNEPFRLMREKQGNFYESVGRSVVRVLTDD